MAAISQEVALEMVRRLMLFPFPTICRHSVACDILSALEADGYALSPELAIAVTHAHDDEALELLA